MASQSSLRVMTRTACAQVVQFWGGGQRVATAPALGNTIAAGT